MSFVTFCKPQVHHASWLPQHGDCVGVNLKGNRIRFSYTQIDLATGQLNPTSPKSSYRSEA